MFVDEACSGVDSLYAPMAICLCLVLWFRQRLFVAVISLSLVPVWASCGNIVRLVSIVLGLKWLGIDLSHGARYIILGLLVFAGAFGSDCAGWRLNTASQQFEQTFGVTDDAPAGMYYPHVVDMKNDEGKFAYIVYAIFQLDGTPVQSAARGVRGLERFEQTILEPVLAQVLVERALRHSIDLNRSKRLELLAEAIPRSDCMLQVFA